MAISADIFDFERRQGWMGPIGASVAFHGILLAAALISGAISLQQGEDWGGAQQGGAMSATLVSSVIPLPSREAVPEQVVANESKGVSQSQPKVEAPEPKAVPIPEKIQKIKPQPHSVTPTRQKPLPVEVAKNNVVPFGQGGPAAASFTMFKSDMGSGGLTVGQGGAFGQRYSWYVDAMRRKISENWLKYEIDPNIQNARRVYLTFDVARDGHPESVNVSQSSGVPSLDQSAVRALERIDTFGPLPPDYAGSKVSVEFFFDYHH